MVEGQEVPARNLELEKRRILVKKKRTFRVSICHAVRVRFLGCVSTSVMTDDCEKLSCARLSIMGIPFLVGLVCPFPRAARQFWGLIGQHPNLESVPNCEADLRFCFQEVRFHSRSEVGQVTLTSTPRRNGSQEEIAQSGRAFLEHRSPHIVLKRGKLRKNG